MNIFSRYEISVNSLEKHSSAVFEAKLSLHFTQSYCSIICQTNQVHRKGTDFVYMHLNIR